MPAEPGGKSGVIRGEEYIVHPAVSGDTWASLADTYLGDRVSKLLFPSFIPIQLAFIHPGIKR